MGRSKEFGTLKRCGFVADTDDEKEFRPLKKCKELNDVPDGVNQLDVISFLSNNGETKHLVRGSTGEFVNLNVVGGKHLVICSVTLPYDFNPHTGPDSSLPYWQLMIDTYPDLIQAGFEMVVSATSKRNKRRYFDNLVSRLPCLVIPFSDLATRHSVNSFIDSNFQSRPPMSVIVVDPSGMIRTRYSLPDLFLNYGFDWFTRDVAHIRKDDTLLKMRLDPIHKSCFDPKSFDRDVLDQLDQPVSLHKDILLCEPSRVLWRFGQPGLQPSLPVSELSNKVIALYLCLNRNFIGELSEAYKRCIENNQELEVVLVCMPYFEQSQLYYEDIARLLKQHGVESWFIFPYERRACQRMHRLFCPLWCTDKVAILPPNCRSSGCLEARAVIHKIGIDAYPFTRCSILEQRVAALKSLTPALLFKGSSAKRTCLVRNGRKSNVRHSAIEGKKLLLYIDWVSLSESRMKLCPLLMKHYPELQAMGCEIVFVPMDCEVGNPPHATLAMMPWPMMPIEAAIESSIVDNFIFEDENYRGDCLIAFGEDGKIRSRYAKERILWDGITESLFNDDYVRKEITNTLSVLEDGFIIP